MYDKDCEIAFDRGHEAGIKDNGGYAQLSEVRELVRFCDWILNSKISLCDKRCLMQDIDTEFGNIKSNYCQRESCPDLVLKLLLDSVRAHFL